MTELAPVDCSGRLTLINIFRPRPGRLERFLELQIEETMRLSRSASAAGWTGNRIHRSLDGRLVIIVTEFADAAAKEEFAKSAAFQEHLQRISPLLEEVVSHPCRKVKSTGTFAKPEAGPHAAPATTA